MPNKVVDFSGVIERNDYTTGDARVLARETADAGATCRGELLAPHNGLHRLGMVAHRTIDYQVYCALLNSTHTDSARNARVTGCTQGTAS